MKLAIINCINGNFSVVSEGHETEQAALVAFHGRCQILWNAPDVITGEVAIVDEQLDVYRGYKELIRHTPIQPEPTSEPEPESENPEDESESGSTEQENNSDLFGL